jgi:hypothetical protein
MTHLAALKKAKRYWGAKGTAFKQSVKYVPSGFEYRVGTIIGGLFCNVYGRGQTYEDAFKDACAKHYA